jgi:hypothetical protein
VTKPHEGQSDASPARDADLKEPEEPKRAGTEERSPLAAVAESIGAGAGAVAGTIGAGAGAVADTIGAGAGAVLSGARRIIGSRGGARVRAVRRMGHEPLLNLWDLHPEARRAAIRELGVRSVSVGDIAGTAVEGPNQRGGDFLPLPDRRSDDWRSRWQRILRANERLDSLPPVELVKFGDSYWVVDGHNRVAAALYTGQDEVDAVVQELRLPGMPAEPPALIAPLLEDSLALRDAGAGRYTRTADRPVDRLPIQTRGDQE